MMGATVSQRFYACSMTLSMTIAVCSMRISQTIVNCWATVRREARGRRDGRRATREASVEGSGVICRRTIEDA